MLFVSHAINKVYLISKEARVIERHIRTYNNFHVTEMQYDSFRPDFVVMIQWYTTYGAGKPQQNIMVVSDNVFV